jgi:hypothetical protein
VVNNVDPLKQARLTLRIPQVLGDANSNWAIPSILTPKLPDNGEQVWVHFVGGDTNRPVYTAGSQNGIEVGDTTDGFFVLPTGITAYHGGVQTFDLTSVGVLTLSGAITGSTITGSTFETATSGERLTISSGATNIINFYTGNSDEVTPGFISYDPSSYTMNLEAGSTTLGGVRPHISLNPDSTSTGGAGSNYLSATADNIDLTTDGGTFSITALGSGGLSLSGNNGMTVGFNTVAFTLGVPTLVFKNSTDGNNNGVMTLSSNTTLKMVSSGTPTIQSRNGADSAYGAMGASAFNIASSKDTKDEIETWAEAALPHILGTRMTKYKRIIAHDEKGTPILSDRHAFGPILEEMPDFLHAEYNTYDMGSAVGLLWKAIQELDNKKQDKGQ